MTPTTTPDQISAWIRGRLPEDWFVEPAEVSVDRDEITVIGTLAEPDSSDTDANSAAEGRIARFREDTREQRIRIAREAERRFERKVAWGAACGETRAVFTNVSTPVMTRLRQPDRLVLDTLVDSGVARSRADALAWCVRLVGQHTDQWLGQLREAMIGVQKLREDGPGL